jgi:hypothetical protein
MTGRVAPRFAGMLAAVLITTSLGAGADDGTGQWRLRRDAPQAATQGPVAQARALDASVAPPVRGRWVTEARWRQSLPLRGGITATADLVLTATRPDGGVTGLSARADELVLTGGPGLWTWSAGRQVVSWDVGFGFRPNDLVQQERRLTLIDTPPQGRPVLMLERFAGDQAISLAWANPGSSTVQEAQRGEEQALAARLYQRLRDADLHLFGRWGQHTRGSLGASTTWVLGDAVAVHAAGRVMQGHVAWRGPVGDTLYERDPWAPALEGAAAQGLWGVTWTSANRWSVMGELWHDGTALSDAHWQTWTERQDALARLDAPARAKAAQWAWQARPLDAPQLRRVAALVRLSWQDGPWLATLDQLRHPADGGCVLTAGLVWQGQKSRVSAVWRRFDGSGRSLAAQLPQQRAAAVEVSWTY